MTRRTSLTLRIAALATIAFELGVFSWLDHRVATNDALLRDRADTVSVAVPDLSRQRYTMIRAVSALRDGDGATARDALESVGFAPRPVELYRRYYLANAEVLVGDRARARRTLAELWAEDPRFVPRTDVAFHLVGLLEEAGDWNGAVSVLAPLLDAEENEEIDEMAYRRSRASLLAAGDPTRWLATAHALALRAPADPAGMSATADYLALGAGFSRVDRISRVRELSREGDAAEALTEIAELRRGGTTIALELARAEALARSGRREDADRIVLALAGGRDTLDRELFSRSWGWWRHAADAIEARAYRTIRVRRRTGTERVKIGGRWITRPVYTTSTRRVKRALSRADQRSLGAANHVLSERGRKLLELGVDLDRELEIRRRLAHVLVRPRKQNELEEHIIRLTELEPSADDLLQLMWDEGWTAWRKRDLDTARERFAFIFRTYHLPNITRQARYWYARCLEDSGERAEAARHFVALSDCRYEDLYAILAKRRVVSRDVESIGMETATPFDTRRDEWVRTAERDMPGELRLAWELSILGLHHDARQEIRRNASRANRSWAYSILARIHEAEDSPLLVANALRHAYPEIGTVELESVPVHFLRMYYPEQHHARIVQAARDRHLDAALVKGLILQESGYDPSARSPAGATGLMQLMAPTAREIAPRVGLRWDESRLVDPAYNIEIGTFYLSSLMAEFHDEPLLTLAAYNAGIGNVRRWLRRDLKGRAPDEVVESLPFSETRGYVKRVTFYRSVYSAMAR